MSGFFLVITYIFLYILNSKLQQKYSKYNIKMLKFLDFIVSTPISVSLFVYSLMLITIPILMVYILTYSALNLILIPDLSTYLALLIVFYITAYKSYYLMNLSIKFFSTTTGFLHSLSIYKSLNLLSNLNLRKWIYFVSIFLYISSRIVLFYNIDISHFKELHLVINVIGEVVLTFLYIDTYISNFKPNILSENEKRLSNLKYAYFNKFKEGFDKIA